MPLGRHQQVTDFSSAIYCSTNWNKWDSMLHLNAFLQHFSCCMLMNSLVAMKVRNIVSSRLKQTCLIFDDAPRTALVLVPLWASWSHSSCGRGQFEGIWQVALSDSGVTYDFQMRLGHPATMPIRQSSPLYPVWEEERIQHKATEFVFMPGSVLQSNTAQVNGTFCKGMMEKVIW